MKETCESCQKEVKYIRFTLRDELSGITSYLCSRKCLVDYVNPQ